MHCFQSLVFLICTLHLSQVILVPLATYFPYCNTIYMLNLNHMYCAELILFHLLHHYYNQCFKNYRLVQVVHIGPRQNRYWHTMYWYDLYQYNIISVHLVKNEETGSCQTVQPVYISPSMDQYVDLRQTCQSFFAHVHALAAYLVFRFLLPRCRQFGNYFRFLHLSQGIQVSSGGLCTHPRGTTCFLLVGF